ncbi:hypothetical protein SDJN02_02034, partial [Cucurbita argyrosperma subsp. argyrosperma]
SIEKIHDVIMAFTAPINTQLDSLPVWMTSISWGLYALALVD